MGRWPIVLATMLAGVLGWWLTRPVPAPVPALSASVPASVPASEPVPEPAVPEEEPQELPGPARPYGFCPQPGERLPAVKRPGFVITEQTKRGMQALRDRDTVAAIAAFEQAQEDPGANLQLAVLLSETLRLQEARDRLARYLAEQPQDVTMARLKARIETQLELHAAHETLEESGVALSYPPDTNSPRDIVRKVDRALGDAAALTGTARRGPLTVIVYRDRSELLAVTCTPAWVGGIFDGTLRLLAEPSDEVIRHEALHAQLSPVMGSEPKWFHEGLAQYFADHGVFRWQRAFSLMVQNNTYVPFASLSGSFFVFDGAQDANLVYAQSLAMVHWLVAEKGERVVSEAVAYFRNGGVSTRLFTHVGASDENALLLFLRAKQP